MALRVEDIIKLQSLRPLRLEAGEGGLHSYIATACILDYECVEGVSRLPYPLFDANSFVISSLLFAKDKPELILPALEKLLRNGVRAFAYKRIFFDKLPPEALEYAEKNNFPIFSFGTDDYFENIIFEIMDAIQRDDARILTESRIRYILDHDSSPTEAFQLKRSLSLPFKRFASAVYFKNAPDSPPIDTEKALRSFYRNKVIKEKAMLGAYEGGIFVLMTSSGKQDVNFRLIFKEYLELSGLNPARLIAASSQVHDANYGLPHCIRESYWAFQTAILEGTFRARFEAIGTCRFLVPLAKNPFLVNYAKTYLAPILPKEELMKTAVIWVRNGGDFVATASALACHQNTIRYRINRIKELTEPASSVDLITDFQLYERLSSAIRIHLLQDEAES